MQIDTRHAATLYAALSLYARQMRDDPDGPAIPEAALACGPFEDLQPLTGDEADALIQRLAAASVEAEPEPGPVPAFFDSNAPCQAEALARELGLYAAIMEQAERDESDAEKLGPDPAVRPWIHKEDGKIADVRHEALVNLLLTSHAKSLNGALAQIAIAAIYLERATDGAYSLGRKMADSEECGRATLDSELVLAAALDSASYALMSAGADLPQRFKDAWGLNPLFSNAPVTFRVARRREAENTRLSV